MREAAGYISDPLLAKLCAPACRDEPLYADIQASAPKPQYLVGKDFPFLQKRLMLLQKFVMEQNAPDLPTLWYDRRDIRKLSRNLEAK